MSENEKRGEDDQDPQVGSTEAEKPSAEPLAPASGSDDEIEFVTPEKTADGDAIEDAEIVGEIPAPDDTASPSEPDVQEVPVEAADEIVLSDAASETSEAEAPESAEIADSEPVPEPDPEPEPVADPEPVAETVDPTAATETAPAEAVLRDGDADRDWREPEPTPAPVAAAAPPPRSRGGFMPALLGGVVAAGIGYGLAVYLDGGFEPAGEAGPDPVQVALDEQRQALASVEERLSSITEELAQPTDAATTGQLEQFAQRLEQSVGALSSELATLSGDLDSLSGSVGAIDERIGGVDASLQGVDDRLTAVEKRPLTESSETAQAAFAAYERELDELTASLSEQQDANTRMADELAAMAETTRSEIAAAEERAATLQQETEARAASLQEEAEATAMAASTRAALADLNTALSRGEPFAGALQVLSEATEIPEVLGSQAETGVAPMSVLRSAFPPAARAALTEAVRDGASGDGSDPLNRLTAFVRNQTGARSLAPREGDDPDAILSRAEAALAGGDLASTLAELASLPEAGQVEMAEWTARAESRLAAIEAVDDLTASLQATN